MYDPKTFVLLQARVAECKTKSVKFAVELLGGNVKEFLRKKAEASKSHEKRLYEQCHNLVTSYVDGLNSGDVTLKDLSSLGSDIAGAEKSYEKRVYEIKSNKAEREARIAAEDGGLDTGMKFDPGIGAADVFKKYEKWKGKLPSHTKKAFTATRLPIVVVSKGIPDIFKLKKTGLVEDFLFGYPILKNQVLVGMSFDWLKSKFSRKDLVDYDAVEEFLTQELGSRTGKRFIRLGQVHKFDQLMWMWLCSEQEFRRLNAASPGGTFAVVDWTLPFEHEVRNMKKR